jgi:hypothetical protein
MLQVQELQQAAATMCFKGTFAAAAVQASINWLQVHFIYTKEQMQELQQAAASEAAALKEGTAKQEQLTSKWHWRLTNLNHRGKC